MRTDLLLPPSLPEHERKADYDYEIVDRKAIILPRSEELPASDQERCEWRIGIRRATFDSIRPVRLPPISDKVSNWGVYFTKAQHGPEEERRYLVLGVNFNDDRTSLLLEAVWHTPNRGPQDPNYHREMLKHEIQKVSKHEELSRVYSYQEIVLHAQYVLREYRSSIVHNVADSAKKTPTGYQLFTNNCQTFAKTLYKELDQPNHWKADWQLAVSITRDPNDTRHAVDDKKAIEMLLMDIVYRTRMSYLIRDFRKRIYALPLGKPITTTMFYGCGISPRSPVNLAAMPDNFSPHLLRRLILSFSTRISKRVEHDLWYKIQVELALFDIRIELASLRLLLHMQALNYPSSDDPQPLNNMDSR